MIPFLEALEFSILAEDPPVVTDFDVYRQGEVLIRVGVWDGVAIKFIPKDWDERRLRAAIRRLVGRQVLASDHDFRSGVWRVVQSTRSGSAEEIACIADPFCYVSHISAMQRFGLTDRSPAALHLSTPARPIWNRMRDDKLARDLATPLPHGFPLLIKFGLKERLRRRPVVVHETRHPAAPMEIRDERTRITTIGQTFVDMLSEPNLCGGMRHVLEVWERHAGDWIDQIVLAVQAHEAKIVKVRAGYILSERLGVEDPRVMAWRAFAQRGGSRKLDPEAPYEPIYSEPWMISLNV